MNLTAYVQRQKNLIRSRRGVAIAKEREDVLVYDRERLLEELENLKGLNKAERLGAAGCKEPKKDFA